MAVLVIEFQGYLTIGNEFFMKEVAIVDVTSNMEKHFLVKPPVPFGELSDRLQKNAEYVRRHIHGIPWNFGSSSVNDVEAEVIKMITDASLVYTKGLTKVQYLTELADCPSEKIVNLDEYPGVGKTTEKDPFFRCPHSHPTHNALRCALEQAVRYRDYMREYYYYRAI